MKTRKGCVCVWAIGLFFLGSSSLLAGGIINKQNLSAEYFRSLNRNAATDAADITVYNPAGVTKMTDGLYLRGDIQCIAKDYTNKVPGFGTLSSDEPSYIPSFFTLYKKNDWAGFFTVTVPGGGGKIDYKDGSARTAVLSQGIISSVTVPVAPGVNLPAFTGIQSMYEKADSYYVGYTLGGSYAINDMFSVAGGLRYVDAYQKFKGNTVLDVNPPLQPTLGATQKFKVDLKRTATGWGYFAGLNVNPIEPLNFGFLYMSNTNLNFKSDVKEDDIGVAPRLGWTDGTHQREDLPGLLAFGVSYKILPQLRTEVDFTYYLESAAKLQNARFEDVGNSWDLGLTVEYAFNPQWMASIGYLRTEIVGMSPDQLLPEVPELDANSLATGLVFSPTDRWRLTVAGLKVWYDSETVNNLGQPPAAPVGTEYKKEVWSLAFGIQYRFF